jgi:hypothetical protein
MLEKFASWRLSQTSVRAQKRILGDENRTGRGRNASRWKAILWAGGSRSRSDYFAACDQRELGKRTGLFATRCADFASSITIQFAGGATTLGAGLADGYCGDLAGDADAAECAERREICH